MGRAMTAAVVLSLFVVGATGARATGPVPAGVVAARPAVAAVPTDHLARLAAPAEAHATPGGPVVATLAPGGVIRTGETLREAGGHWHEIVTPHGLVWIEADAFAGEAIPALH